MSVEQKRFYSSNSRSSESEQQKLKVKWYRSCVSREQLQVLNRRSDSKGLLQTCGFLGLLTLTGYTAFLAIGRLAWPLVVLLFFFHGICWAFLANGFHELVHDSVFKTKYLNEFFLRIFAFLSWSNHHQFWASHTEHHKYTLHPPRDLEVVLPIDSTLKGFLTGAFVSPVGLWYSLSTTIKTACGKVEGPWDTALFPESKPEERRQLFRWARILLVGQTTIIIFSVVMRWWWLPVEITLAPFYGGWLFYLCNNSQHIGLQDNVKDFRLCCRTITLNPFLGFLYWHMNYHTEHHMYAAVPCYNLKKLHALIKSDLPTCSRGLFRTWKQIIAILDRQKLDRMYQYVPELPVSILDLNVSTAERQRERDATIDLSMGRRSL
jgi:fatty acid desaturase